MAQEHERDYLDNHPCEPWSSRPRRHKMTQCLGAHLMLRTRLYVECPNCRMHYLMKDFGLTYSNGAYIENVAGAPEWQRLICPCRPQDPYKFKLKEKTRLHLLSERDSEQTHFSLKPVKSSVTPAVS
jgi:hypothetical protein